MIGTLKSRMWFKFKRFVTKKKSSGLNRALKNSHADQSKIVDIAKHIMLNPETKFIHSYLSNSMYMEYKDVVCKIEKYNIIITNGLYSYNIGVSELITEDLIKRYLNLMESKKRAVEKKAIDKLTSSLGRVYEELSSKNEI